MSYKAIISVPLFIFLVGMFNYSVRNNSLDAESPHGIIVQLEKHAFPELDSEITDTLQSNFYSDVFMSDHPEVHINEEEVGLVMAEYQGFDPVCYQ